MKKASPFTFYLLYFAALAAFSPFFVLYLQSVGLSGIQIGVLTGIIPLISLVGGPFWTGLADTTHRHKLVLSIAMAAAVIGGILFPFMRSIAAVAVLAFLYTFFIAPIISLSDSATMAMLGSEKHMYGRVRLGGTIGWGVFAPIVGWLVNSYGLSWAFWSYAALMFLGLLVSQSYTFPRVVEGVSLLTGFRRLAANRSWLLFLALAFICGMGVTTVNYYLFTYMKEMQASETQMGFALTISTISELPILFFAHRFLKKIGSRRLLRLSMLATAVRLLLYATIFSPAWVLISQILNGVTFPLFWVAGVAYADESAPPGLHATAQGLFGSLSFGFGAAAGGFLGGFLLDAVGAHGMFGISGAIMLVSLVLITLIEAQRPASLDATSA